MGRRLIPGVARLHYDLLDERTDHLSGIRAVIRGKARVRFGDRAVLVKRLSMFSTS